MSGETATEAGQVSEGTSRSRRHFGNLVSGEILNKVLRFGAAAVLARALSLSDYGVFNVGIAISGVLVVATNLGLPEIGTREVAVKRDEASLISSRVVWGRLLALTPALIITIAAGNAIWPGHLMIFVAAGLLAIPMAATADWLDRGLERMRAVAMATAAGGLVAALGSLILWQTHGTSTSSLLVFAAAEAVAAALCWRAAGRASLPTLTLNGLGAMVKRSWPVALSSLAIYSYLANIDTIIMAGTRGTADAGLYSAPYRLFLTLNVIPVFAAYATFPIIAQAAHSGRMDDGRRVLRENRKDLLVYGLAALAGAELIGKPMLGILFGHQFESVSTTVALLTSAVAWYAIGYSDGYSLVAEDRSRGFLAGALTAGILNLVLDIILIPPMGPKGAGLATAAAFMSAALVWILWRGRPDRLTIFAIVIVALATGGALLIAFAGFSSIAVGAVTLVAAIIGACFRAGKRLKQRSDG